MIMTNNKSIKNYFKSYVSVLNYFYPDQYPPKYKSFTTPRTNIQTLTRLNKKISIFASFNIYDPSFEYFFF